MVKSKEQWVIWLGGTSQGNKGLGGETLKSFMGSSRELAWEN